jgi:hypothetical protein
MEPGRWWAGKQLLIWTGWSLGLNLLWEVGQLPFFAFPADVGAVGIIWAVLHCTAGDGGIALASFAAAAIATRRLGWPATRPTLGLLVALLFGLAWTVQSEYVNVYVRGRWAYNSSMPLLGGIGMMPLLQWTLLPPFVLVLTRRSAARANPTRDRAGGFVQRH